MTDSAVLKILVTGSDFRLGGLLNRGLRSDGEVFSAGTAPAPGQDLDGCEYRSLDLRDKEGVRDLVDGFDVIVHSMPFEADAPIDAPSETELLDQIARGTYELALAAIEADVSRIVLITNLSVVKDYPDNYRVTPDWRPIPGANAESLAPYMAELVCREIARTGQIEVICLRFGNLDEEDGTSAKDAVESVRGALTGEIESGHSWQLRHVASSGRFAQ